MHDFYRRTPLETQLERFCWETLAIINENKPFCKGTVILFSYNTVTIL